MGIKTVWRVTICGAQGWWDDNCLRLAASQSTPGEPIDASPTE